MSGARVFAIANQKGGVGKTTTTINLAAYLAHLGRKTLVIDMDPQSNTTMGLGIDTHQVNLPLSMYDLLVGEGVSIRDVMLNPQQRPNLWLLPATVDLYAADIELVYKFDSGREFRLRTALDAVRDQFDFVLIDCPPSLGLLTINALTAADGVVLPLQCEYFALEGMHQLLNTIRLVRDRLNPSISLFGVVLTMFDPRTRLSNEVVDEITRHFPNERFGSVIPRAVRVAEAPSHGKTIQEYDDRSPAALAYKDLAEEVIARAAAMEATHA